MTDPRLSVRIDGRPVVVRLTARQRAEVARHAAHAGASVSAWVRETLDAARGSRTHAQAADDAGLDVTSWVRVLVLERANETDLRAQLADAACPALSMAR